MKDKRFFFRYDEDGFKRLTIQLGEDNPMLEDKVIDSINVLAKDGSDLCRINLFSNDDGSWGDVDVILLYGNKQGRFFAMSNGKSVVNLSPENVTVYAIDIRDKDF